jgi:DNA-binding transcriptional ArsR family regulator
MVDYTGSADLAFAALADPTRRAILTRLRVGASTVSALAEPFDMSLAAVSKHVRLLERAGLIRREVKGREHYCHLQAGPLREVARWAAYVAAWEERLDALEVHLGRSKTRNRRAKR